MPKLRKQFAAIAAILLAACMTVPLALADMNGIDVSGWQSPTVTCTADYDFAVVKATQGTGFTNGYMTSQTRCVKQRGKSLGFYHCVLSSCYRPVWREFSFRKSGRF